MNDSKAADTTYESTALSDSEGVQKARGFHPRVRNKFEGRRKFIQGSMFGLFKIASAINGLALLVIVYFLVARGWRAINWTFLTQPPLESLTKGGILPCIVGTVCLSLGAILVALPVGVASAIYLMNMRVLDVQCG